MTGTFCYIGKNIKGFYALLGFILSERHKIARVEVAAEQWSRTRITLDSAKRERLDHYIEIYVYDSHGVVVHSFRDQYSSKNLTGVLEKLRETEMGFKKIQIAANEVRDRIKFLIPDVEIKTRF